MLFKISLSNIRNSIKDYAIYFFTLIIGVSIFYIFNAIGTQTAYLEVSQNTKDIIDLLVGMLSGVSVFVSAVLGLLIVYASRFLMKRRSKEFALYLLLGMGKGTISTILLLETLIIGIGSLLIGLAAGIGLSQISSALVANLFEADMTVYKFTVSSDAIIKTLIYFGIMYVVVMLFNSVMINKCKLIDLLNSNRKGEKQKLKNPFFCTVIFILAVIALSYAYYNVAISKELQSSMNENKILKMIGLGAASTFLIFWSVSGLLIRLLTSAKKAYFKGLNAFTFRQVSSKINTMVMSMTVICLMLFVTICALSSAFSIRNSMNANLNELCPADIQIYHYAFDRESGEMAPLDTDQAPVVTDIYSLIGYDITDELSDYVHLRLYNSEEFTMGDFCGDELDAIKDQFLYLNYGAMEDIISLSDYNRLMELYGKEPLQLNDDEYILLCNFDAMAGVRDRVLAAGGEITVFGYTLKPKYDQCQDGFIQISAQKLNIGIFVVPDYVVSGESPIQDYFTGNYAAETREEKAAVESRLLDTYTTVRDAAKDGMEMSHRFSVNTRIDIAEATVGLGAIASLLGLYIGLVFLISCGVILALQQLSESVDSMHRYTILRKIGTEEKDISNSLFRQTGIFFLLPLLLACVHSVFGMKFAMVFLELFGTEKMMESVLSTSAIILLIYGGYFLITYFCSKSIIREKM